MIESMVKIFKILVIVVAVIVSYIYFRNELRDMRHNLAMDRIELEQFKKGIYISVRGADTLRVDTLKIRK